MKLRELFQSDVTRDIPPVVYFHEQSPAKLEAEVGEYIITGGFPPEPTCSMKVALLVVNNARQIFNCQRSDFFGTAEDVENQLPTSVGYSPSDFFALGV